MSIELLDRLLPKGIILWVVAFFVVLTVLVGAVVVPKINGALDRQFTEAAFTTLNIESEFLDRFVDTRVIALEDLATFPVVTSATLLSSSENPNFTDLLDGYVLLGDMWPVVLQDFSGSMIYGADDRLVRLQAENTAAVNALISGSARYRIQLLTSADNRIEFILSVPVHYQGSAEGVLSTLISTVPERIFSPSAMVGGNAFRLQQNNIIVETDRSSVFFSAKEVSTFVANTNIELTYISDNENLQREQRNLRNSIFFILVISLGVSLFVFSAINLKRLSPEIKTNNAKRDSIQPLLIGSLCFIFSLAAAGFLYFLQEQRFRENVITNSNLYLRTFEEALNRKFGALNSLKAYLESSEEVGRPDFERFSTHLLQQNTGVRALSWAPQVRNSERATYQLNSRREGLPDFVITERDSEGSIITAAERDVYFPVYFIEPLVGNETAAGFDLASNSSRRQMLEHARNVDGLVASEPITLVQEGGEDKGVLIANPVYRMRQSASGSDENFLGYATLVLYIPEMIGSIYQSDSANSRLTIQDVTHSDNRVRLYGEASSADSFSSYNLTKVVNVAGRQWEITVSPSFLVSRHALFYLPLVILVLGSVFAIFVSLSMRQQLNRRAVVEKVVEQRTRQIQEASEFQSLIMENIPDLLFVKDEKYRITMANDAFLNVYPEDMRDQIIGYTTLESYDEEEAESFLHYDTLALKEGRSEVEEKIRFPDGEERTLFTKKVRFESDGKNFVLGLGRDISDIRKAEAESQALRDAMENTVEGISEIDTQGRYLYVNESYAAICGYMPEELIGKEWQMTVAKDDHELMSTAYQTMLETGKVVAEPRGLRSDGSMFFKRVTMISRFDSQNEFVGQYCFMSDISKRKKAENELIRSNQELDDFAYIASHDMKEPLRGIHNHVRLLVDEHKDNLNEEGQHRLERIMYLSSRMTQLISELLYYSRLGRADYEKILLDPNAIIDDLLPMFAEEPDLQIDVCGRLPMLSCNPAQLKEVFLNLITNAIKYNEADEKRIEVRAKPSNSGFNKSYAVISICDNGIGIDPKFHKDVFKIFNRLHKRDAYRGGTGSGLTFTKKIIENHGGEVWIDSALGSGSTFFFTLPLAEKTKGTNK